MGLENVPLNGCKFNLTCLKCISIKRGEPSKPVEAVKWCWNTDTRYMLRSPQPHCQRTLLICWLVKTAPIHQISLCTLLRCCPAVPHLSFQPHPHTPHHPPAGSLHAPGISSLPTICDPVRGASQVLTICEGWCGLDGKRVTCGCSSSKRIKCEMSEWN